MGHEFCGVVTNPGESNFKVGDRVTFWANLYCSECDMFMVAYHAVGKANIKLWQKVLVVGTGIIGHMIAELAKKSSAAYVAMSKLHDHKVAVAKKAGFVDEFFEDKTIREDVKKILPKGFDVAFEVVGAASALDHCIQTVKPGGKVIMIGNSMTETIPVNINRAVLILLQRKL